MTPAPQIDFNSPGLRRFTAITVSATIASCALRVTGNTLLTFAKRMLIASPMQSNAQNGIFGVTVVPCPRHGALVRILGEAMRATKAALSEFVPSDRQDRHRTL